jgi:tetratricopeptide (TPR) repeat protein
LQPPEQGRLNRRPSVEPPAYEAYLRGRFAAGRVSDGPSLAEALSAFELATSLDPTFALPWVGIARTLSYRAVFGYADRNETVDRAARAIARALVLDPDLGEALAARGHLNLVLNADGAAAVRDLERAVAQEPNSVPSLLDYGMALNSQGRYADAADAFDRAAERDPLSPTTAMMRGWSRYIGRRYQEARLFLEQGIRVSPDFSYNHLWLGAALIQLGFAAEARDAAARAETIEGSETDDVNFLCVLGWVWARAGKSDRAASIRDRLLTMRQQGKPVDASFLLVLETGMGNMDVALAHMQHAVAARSPILFHLPGHPFLDPLRGDPRFERLLAQSGLTPLAH